MSSINRFGGGVSGVQGTHLGGSPEVGPSRSGGQTSALSDSVRTSALQGGPSGLPSVQTPRLSDFTITAGPGTRTPAPGGDLADQAGTALKALATRFEGASIGQLLRPRD